MPFECLRPDDDADDDWDGTFCNSADRERCGLGGEIIPCCCFGDILVCSEKVLVGECCIVGDGLRIMAGTCSGCSTMVDEVSEVDDATNADEVNADDVNADDVNADNVRDEDGVAIDDDDVTNAGDITGCDNDDVADADDITEGENEVVDKEAVTDGTKDKPDSDEPVGDSRGRKTKGESTEGDI